MKQLLLKISPVYKFVIIGESMSPLLRSGATVLVNRWSYLFKKPKVGDVVAAFDPRDGKVLIKRIIEVKNNQFFIIGDNRKDSIDSRTFGSITKKDLVGKVIFN